MRRSMMHDPDVCSNPAGFRPEQFFDNEPAIAVVALAFESGRRCVFFFALHYRTGPPTAELLLEYKTGTIRYVCFRG